MTAIASVGCLTPVDDVPAPPANPAIENTAGPITLTSKIECDGPAEELALLGSMCGASIDPAGWRGTNAERGMATALGPEHGGPLLLIYNRLDRDPGLANVAAEVKYSAFVLLSAGDRFSEATLGEWAKAEPVSAGQVTSQMVRFEACSFSWIADGTFTWRATQLHVSWSASRAC